MKLPFDESAWDIGVGQCTVHNTVTIYAIFMDMNIKTQIATVGVFCSECYRIHGENVRITQRKLTLKDFGQRMYFEDKTRDN